MTQAPVIRFITSNVAITTKHAITFGSCELNALQRKYCTTRTELPAIVRFNRQFRHFQFVSRIDHISLTVILRFKNADRMQLARWLEVLAQHVMKIHHRAGAKYINAEWL